MSMSQEIRLTMLEQLIHGHVVLLHNVEIPDQVFGDITAGTRKEVVPLESKRFRRWLMDFARQQLGQRFHDSEIRIVVAQAAARAQFSGHACRFALRVGEDGGFTHVDLADGTGRAVAISPEAGGSWEVVDATQIRFLRPTGTLALAIPEEGGTIAELRDMLGLEDDHQWVLAATWLLSTLRPRGPFPVLFLHGEQGTAKSTRSKMLKSLVDPSAIAIQSAPSSERDLIIRANNSWLLAFDNLSAISDDLSDSICRMATGAGFSARKLFTDAEEALFSIQRPMLFNGIEEVVVRSDLLDRTLWVTLATIPDTCRKSEQEIWAQFDRARPRITGAIFGVLSRALADLPAVSAGRLPRMADFATLGIAAEPHLGVSPGTFMRAFEANRSRADELVIEASPLGQAIVLYMERRPEFHGSAESLLSTLEADAHDRLQHAPGWPRTPRKLSGILRRIAPNLRRLGIDPIFQDRTGSQRPILLKNRTYTKRPTAIDPAAEYAFTAEDVRAIFDARSRPVAHPESGEEAVAEAAS